MVCVDESGVVAGTRLAYGYAPRGEHCVEHAPYQRGRHQRGRRTNLIGWLGRGRVVVAEDRVDGDLFEQFVREHLAPHLRRGDIVVWDNVVWDNHSIHRRPVLRTLIEARGAVLAPQPRYSPETNACEEMWSKLKQGLRRARADTGEALRVALATGVGALTGSDSAGWLQHAGYVLTPIE